jgi:hypothetical protein
VPPGLHGKEVTVRNELLAAACTSQPVNGDLYWLIGWCVLFVCVAVVICTGILALR